MSLPPTHDEVDDTDDGNDVVDLDDPNLAVIDDAHVSALAAGNDGDDEDEDEDEEGYGKDDDDGDGGGEFIYDGEDEEANAGVDLNAVPDVEPARDDAVASFTPLGAQPLHAVAVHPRDGALLAAAGEAEVVYILRVTSIPATNAAASAGGDGSSNNNNNNNTTLTLLHTLTGHSDTVSQLAFSPDGAWLASAGLDGSVAVWRTQTWSCAHVLRDLYGEVLSLLWHPSSLVLVASADDAQTAMWSVPRGALLHYFAGHSAAVACVAWSSDHKRLLTGSSDGTLIVHNCKTAEQELRITRDLSADHAGITALCVPAVTAATTTMAASSDQCLVGCDDGTLHIVALRTGKVVVHAQEVHTQAIEVLRVNDAGTLLLSASCDCRVVVWHASDCSVRAVLDVGEGVVAALWLRGFTVVAGCSDGSVRAWDGRDVAQAPQRVWLGHRRLILALAVAHSSGDDGSNNNNNSSGGGGDAQTAVATPLLVSASDDGSLRVFACDVRDTNTTAAAALPAPAAA